MPDVSKQKTYLALLVSVLALSQAAILVRLAESSAEVLGFWRVVFTCLATAILMLIRKESLSLDYLRINFQDICIAGVLFCLHFWLWFRGVQLTSIANAVVIFNLNPIFISLASKFFYNEKLTANLILALLLGVLGVIIIKWESLSLESAGTIGDLFVLLGCVVFSGYVLKAKTLREKGSNLALTFYFNFISLLGFGAAVLLKEERFFGYSNQSWFAFIGMAIVPSILGHALFTYSLKHVKATVASCAKLLEPVGAAIVATLVFGETITMRLFVGFFIVVLGLLNLFLRS